MIIILGKTGSGKDSIINSLMIKHGYKRIIVYTTRPMRKNEMQHKDYHFISEEDFKQKISSEFFAEWKVYTTTEGIWYYGSAIEDYEMADAKTVVILTPAGYQDIIKRLANKPFSFYIHSDIKTVRKRAIMRGDNMNEFMRRTEQDERDFENVEQLVDEVIDNNGDAHIDEVANKIVELIKSKKRLNK